MAETWHHKRPRLLNTTLAVQLFLRAALVILVDRCRDVETVIHPREGLRPNGRVGLCACGKSNVGELFRKLHKCRLGTLRNQRDPPLHTTVTLGCINRCQFPPDAQIHQQRPKILVHPFGAVVRQNTPASPWTPTRCFTDAYHVLKARTTVGPLLSPRNTVHPKLV